MTHRQTDGSHIMYRFCRCLSDVHSFILSNLFQVAHSSGVAKIMFIPAKRPLRGKYVLRAKNQFGEDAAEVEINVWGKPTVPRGAIQ